jgi:CelD/BcsL family acetyltransferase involved in cellulose biosynthesis
MRCHAKAGDMTARGVSVSSSSNSVSSRLVGAVSVAGYDVQIASSLAEIADLRPAYARLGLVTDNTLPFSLFEWQFAWCRHFLRAAPGIVDQPMFHVVRDREGACVAIVPLVVTRHRLGRLSFSFVSLIGSDPAVTEIRTSLVQPGYESRVAALLDLSLHDGKGWDCIHWTGHVDRFNTAIGERRRLEWQPAAASYVLDLPPTWDAFRAGLKHNIRESLRHCYNSLKRAGLAFELKVARTPGGIADALRRLFVLHALRAAMPATVVHPDRFAAEGVREFILEVCGDLAACDVTRVFELEIDGHVVASRIGFAVGDSLYLYYSGFDPAWSKFSVMTTTVAEAIKYAIALGLKTVNLSPGNDVSKTRWGPREVPTQSAYERSGRLGSRLMSGAYIKARSGEGIQGWLLQRVMPGRRQWN